MGAQAIQNYHWLAKKSFKDLVLSHWNSVTASGGEGFQLWRKLKDLKRLIIAWNSEANGNILKAVRVVEQRISEIDTLAEDDCNNRVLKSERRSLTSKLWKSYKDIESMQRHKSRMLWLKKGDANTGYFNAVVN